MIIIVVHNYCVTVTARAAQVAQCANAGATSTINIALVRHAPRATRARAACSGHVIMKLSIILIYSSPRERVLLRSELLTELWYSAGRKYTAFLSLVY